MKILLILIIPVFLCSEVVAQGITSRRTLVEEFTSSSSDSCAQTDFTMDTFEGGSAKNFCIVKWYLPYGSPGGTNTLYNDYLLSRTRSESYYGNLTVPQVFINGASHFNPYGLSVDGLNAKVSAAYSETSTFVLEVTGQVITDSIITVVTVRSLDTTIDLSQVSLGVIVAERYKQYSDVNHFPYHTNIVRTVLPSLDAKTGEIRDAIPFALAMQGVTQKTFRFAAKVGSSWDRYGLISVAVIQNNATKEVLQSNWNVPDFIFERPTTNTFLFDQGTTPLQFTLRNLSDTDITVTPQLTTNAPNEWNLQILAMPLPNFQLKAHTAITGTFTSDRLIPFRGSGDFILLLRIVPGTVLANISGTLVGNDSRDLIIKHWTSAVYKSDPDITAWTQFGLDPAIVNDDALGTLFNNNLNRFRTIYVERSVLGDSSDLAMLRNFLSLGGRLLFHSTSVNKLFSASILDTLNNRYALDFLNIFHTTPATPSTLNWTKGNVMKGEVFSDTLQSSFTVSARTIEPLVPHDTHSKPMIIEQRDKNVGVSVHSSYGKIAYLTFPLSDILEPGNSAFLMQNILRWFAIREKVTAPGNDFIIEVYPNPASTVTTLRYEGLDNTPALFIRDELGKSVTVAQEYSGQEIHLDCSKLPEGTYYYELKSGSSAARGKLLISR